MKCWWRFFHDWSMWELVGRDADWGTPIQGRICKRCGRMQRRLV